MNMVLFCTYSKLKLYHKQSKRIYLLQIVDVVLQLGYQLAESDLEVEVLHTLSRLQAGLVEELLDDRQPTGALHEVMVQLAKEVPVLDHR